MSAKPWTLNELIEHLTKIRDFHKVPNAKVSVMIDNEDEQWEEFMTDVAYCDSKFSGPSVILLSEKEE